MDLNGVEYYYIRNAQGDIIGLFDKTEAQLVAYTYDTWGKLISTTGSLSSTVGVKNEYRYRGYRYDTETGLYYLQSRYYSPDWGRFINCDDIDILKMDGKGLLDYNVFAYCNNNTVNSIDSDGYFAVPWLAAYAIPAGVGEVLLGATVLVGASYGVYKAKGYIRSLGFSIVTSLTISAVRVGIYFNSKVKTVATPTSGPAGFDKLKGDQGYRNKATGDIWKKDMLHKDHWNISNKKEKSKMGGL